MTLLPIMHNDTKSHKHKLMAIINIIIILSDQETEGPVPSCDASAWRQIIRRIEG